jgi:hypothetical protein
LQLAFSLSYRSFSFLLAGALIWGAAYYLSLKSPRVERWQVAGLSKVEVHLETSCSDQKKAPSARKLSLALSLQPIGSASQGMVYKASIDRFELFLGDVSLLTFTREGEHIRYQASGRGGEALLALFNIDLSDFEVQKDHALFQNPLHLYLQESGRIGQLSNCELLQKALLHPKLFGSSSFLSDYLASPESYSFFLSEQIAEERSPLALVPFFKPLSEVGAGETGFELQGQRELSSGWTEQLTGTLLLKEAREVGCIPFLELFLQKRRSKALFQEALEQKEELRASFSLYYRAGDQK